MKRFFSLVFLALMASLMVACGGGGGSAGTPIGSASPDNFQVNAPSIATLAVGQKASYTISGGLAPYTLSNTAPAVLTAVVTGSVIEVTPLNAGSATLTVSPSGGGATYSIAVTVASSINPLQAQAPDSVTLQLNNTGTYAISGGVPPYRAVSSSPGTISAVVVGNSLQVTAAGVGSGAVQIYDASSAQIQRTFTVVTTAAFFTDAPSALNLAVSAPAKTYTVKGGVAPYFVSSSNPAVADASVSGGTLGIVSGNTNGSASIVLRDSGGSTLAIAVTVGTSAALFSNAPTELTIQGGSSRDFTVGGGTAPYSVASGDTNVVLATISGATLTLTAQNKGTTTVSITDSAGASISVAVTVSTGSAFAVSAIELTSNLASIASGGTEATITALVKGASNVGVPNADITFSSDSGILLSPSVQTDASGIATVRLGAGSNKANRTIVVTARVGTVSQNISISVTGTTVSAPSTLAYTKSSSPVTDELNTVTVRDSAGNPVSGITLSATRKVNTVSLGNAVSFSPAQTDVNGKAVLVYTPSTDGTETLVVTGAGVNSGDIVVSVSPLVFAFDKIKTPLPDAALKVGADIEFKVNLSGVTTKSGRSITFLTTRGTLKRTTSAPCPGTDCNNPLTVPTDGNGDASVFLNSASAGAALVTAQVNRITGDPGAGTVGDVLIKSTRQVYLTGTTPFQLLLQINPGTIAPNASGSSTNKAFLAAYVTDADSNPVANTPVIFQIVTDPSNGRLSAGIANTGNDGYARVEYFSGAQSTATNGVSIKAQATTGTTAPSDTKSLTVSGNALFINIGFGNTIDNLDVSTYRKPFVVYVTDATGNAVVNQTVTLEVFPKNYRRGGLVYDTNSGVWGVSLPPAANATVTEWCSNEDSNKDGILDLGEDTNADGIFNRSEDLNKNGILDLGEDLNVNGKLDSRDEDSNSNGKYDGEDKNHDLRLTPGNVVFVSPLSVQTDASGVAAFNLLYGEQFAPWVEVDITARATVAGTESRQTLSFGLTGLSEDFTNVGNPPAGRYSPFGPLSSTIGGIVTTSCP